MHAGAKYGFSVSGDSSHPQLNVTPLIDILLVLIIIFMFIVSMTRSQGLEAAIPQPANGKSHQAESTIVIQLHAEAQSSIPTLKLNNEEVSWNNLQGKLQKIYASRMDRIAFVRGDDDVDFQYVAEVIDEAKGAGVDHIGLMTKQ